MLGLLADDGRDLLFEYTPEAIRGGLELSPYKLPLATTTYGDFPEHQLRLPGLVSDALPDGWGMLLMDRYFRAQGRELALVSPLDRLAFIGDAAMGALTFEPASREDLTPADLKLLELARDVRQVMSDDSDALLKKLLLMGGSPHGARPKVLVYFDRKSNSMSNSEMEAGIPLLVKFPAQNEHKEVCAIEAMYLMIANECGMRVPAAEYFDLSKELSAFGIERFDRVSKMRVPMHTAAGAAHVNFRLPQLDYIALLRLTRLITRDERELLQTFERCVFNVVFHNRDDHSKNFSYLMDKDGHWRLSPGYDLTFSEGLNGEHQMDICGEARAPVRKHLLELARKTGIPERSAVDIMERIVGVAERFREFADRFPIRRTTLKTIESAVSSACVSLAK